MSTNLDLSKSGPTVVDHHRSPLAKVAQFLRDECTFFRIHLFSFTFIPLIFSGVFYACNGRFRVEFVDSLFLCYSSMTVTGLSTVDLSTLTSWQQVMLYLLMMIGDVSVVSWLMVLTRKHFFRTHCEYVVATHSRRLPFLHRTKTAVLKSISSPLMFMKDKDALNGTSEKQDRPNVEILQPTPGGTLETFDSPDAREGQEVFILSESPRAQSIALSPTESRHSRVFPTNPTSQNGRLTTIREGVPYSRRGTTILAPKNNENPISPGVPSKKYQGLGGFPGMVWVANRLFQRAAPSVYRTVSRKLTMPVTKTLESENVAWLNFDGLVVGRNSDFHTETLEDEEVEQIGGAEYRALRLLSYLIPAYFVISQLIAFLLFAPWLLSTTQYDNVFQAQPRLVQKPWFSLFQVMGAYTGGGLSLVDLGMVPFQGAYLMIFALMFVILAGNHALPIFLRLVIWIGYKFSSEQSDARQALSFLLDHPRRCFLYLFPSHQTWFLVICLVVFSTIEWAAFGVLDIGLAAFESIPTGPRIVAGLFQGLAVRASGFSIVPIASFAPALQFLYVVMMYIAIYPVAMSIRSTNVYEERSLGVFEAPPSEENEEPADLSKFEGRERIGRYLGWHLRRQMSIDIWWLIWGVFLVAIIERNNLLDDDKKWFDLFRVLFELVSAFGGIGLSLGLPTDNFSFVGAMHPLSKLVVIVIMVRGRHRGLPVAVDRAVLLPSDLVINQPASKGNGQATETRPQPSV